MSNITPLYFGHRQPAREARRSNDGAFKVAFAIAVGSAFLAGMAAHAIIRAVLG